MEQHPVILFDGVCNLCNKAVQFVIKHDPQAKFKFAPLQGNAAAALIQKYQLTENIPDSFILIQDNHVYSKSGAALRVARRLKGFPKLFYVFMIIPATLRDAVYNLVARKRYNWFGKKNSCMIPSPELMTRFLN